MRAAVATILAVILALAPGAQAAVIHGRGTAAPIGGLGLATFGFAPQLSAPSLTGLTALGLNTTLAAPAFAPVPSEVMAARVAALPLAAAIRPVQALGARVLPAAIAPEHPGDDPGKAGRIQNRFDELRAAFDEKAPQAVQAGPAARPTHNAALLPHADLETSNDLTAPPKPPAETPRKGLFGFSRPLTYFLVALIIAQVGAETQMAALPPLISKVFGNVSVLAHIGMVASLSELAGTVMAPVAAKMMGLKKAYLSSTAVRVVAGGLIAGLLAANWLGLSGLIVLFAVESLFLGISYTIEKSIPAVMLNQDQAKLERFKAARQIAIESAATIVPIVTGALIATFGFIPALVAFPLAMAVSMALVAVTLKLPGRIASVKASPLPEPRNDSISAYFRHLGRGALAIVRKPVLLFSLLTYSFVYAPTAIIYWLLAPAFALQMTGDAAHAAAYAGMITGLYSLGGFIAGVLMLRRQKKPQDAASMRKSMLRWTLTAAVAMTLFGALALPGLAWGTLTIPAIALLFFGIPQVISKLKLESFFQAHAPKDSVDDATAMLEGTSSIMIALGLWWFGAMLTGGHITSLTWLTAATAPLALPLLVLLWALARASKKI